MYKLNIFLMNFFIFMGLIKIVTNYKYLLMTLITVEYIVLLLLLLLFLYLNKLNFEMFFLMVYLTFSVCEGVLGLSLLISMSRNFGNTYFQVLNSFLC